MANNLDINKTVEAWADIVVKNWRRKITELDIGITGSLYDSFEFEVISQAGGSPERIDFAFEYYGRFVDMGVGRDVPVGNPGDVKTRRKAKRWYSSIMYTQANKLSQILSEKYGIIGSSLIREQITRMNSKARVPRGAKGLGDAANRRGFLQRNYEAPGSGNGYSELTKIWRQRNGLPID